MDNKKEILRRYLGDNFSFNDYLSVSSAFKNDKLKDLMEEDWQVTKNTSNNTERLEQILNKLHNYINKKSTFKSGNSRKFQRLFSKIASILIIPALITISVLSYFSVNSNTKVAFAEIHAPINTRTKFQLPDGTKGWLNSGSSIKYPVNFKKRRVEISGEAWFDVVHKKSKPFSVATPYFDIKVMGTCFNVIAYKKEATAEVILERGEVILIDKQKNVISKMLPDQQIIYNKNTKQIARKNIDSKIYSSWKDGLLICRNIPMEEIAKRLERKFNVEIILHGNHLKKAVFRATFEDENLDEICKMLATVTPIRYIIHDRKMLNNYTFSKKKVEMWLIK